MVQDSMIVDTDFDMTFVENNFLIESSSISDYFYNSSVVDSMLIMTEDDLLVLIYYKFQIK